MHSPPRSDGWGNPWIGTDQIDGYTLNYYKITEGKGGVKAHIYGPDGLFIKGYPRDTIDEIVTALRDDIEQGRIK